MTGAAWAPPAPGTRWLLRLPNWIGDAILVLPALRSLPRRDQVRLGVAHPRVIDLYRASGLLDELWPAAGWRAPASLARRLRAWKPERAVVFTEAISGALLARTAGSAQRLGPGRAVTRPFLTRALEEAGRGRPLWRHYVELAREAGGGPAVPDFRLDPGPAAAQRAEDLMEGIPEGDAVALAPGAIYGPSKQWPGESFAALARTLADRKIPVVVVGGAAEREAGAALAAATGARDVTGATGLLEAIAVLARCRALVTNDSGALHLARAAGTPVVALFGSTSPVWTGPEPEEGETLWLGLPCSPCFRRRCPLPAADHLRCLREIEVDTVVAALERVVARVGEARP